MGEDPKKAFIRLFNETARYHHRGRVFEDLIFCASISLENAWLKSDELEQEYLEVIGRYEPDDVARFPQLFALITTGIGLNCDFLGSLFMELELGSDRMGQFFTPYSVARFMGKALLDDIEIHLSEKPFVTIQEPACGAGGMIIAAADALKEKGYNPQQQMWVHCTDIDAVAARLCYLQLALLGIPGVVIIGNTLTLETRRAMYTPMHHMGFWNAKLRNHWQEDTATTDLPVVEQLPSTSPFPKSTVTEPKEEVQLSMFDLLAPAKTGTE